MTTVTVTINPRTKRAQGLLTIIQELSKIDNGIEIKSVENKKLPPATRKNLSPALSEAIKDMNAGRVYKAKNADQMINDCLK